MSQDIADTPNPQWVRGVFAFRPGRRRFAIARLHDAGVVRPLSNRTRNQIWVAASVADELDDLGVRIAARARAG